MKSVLAMVLVGGRGSRLHSMTKHTAKPAVPFLGKYKLIDFVLSNLTHSFIDTVGIITQYEPQELMNYIQRGSSWDLDVREGGIHFLTPYQSQAGEQFQRGTADAIKQHFYFIEQYQAEWVLIASGDHVYKMDYRPMIEFARLNDADVTIAAFKPDDSLSRYGVLDFDEDGTLLAFAEKPDNPKSDYASMGLYVFKKAALKRLLFEAAGDYFDFGHDLIPLAIKQAMNIRVFAYGGYFRDVGTVDSYYDTTMELLDRPDWIGLYDYKDAPLYSRSYDLPPHHIASPYPIRRSFISDGCLIMGRVEHSVISHNVVLKENAFVMDSILFPGVSVGENAVVKNAIILDQTVILPGAKLVYKTPTVVDNETLWALTQGGAQDER